MNASRPDGAAALRLVLGGDAMLGREVGACIRRVGAAYSLGRVAELIRVADLAVVNLECAITRRTEPWRGAPKAFYFRGPPLAAHTLADAGVGMVSLANNHILDFGPDGLRDTICALERCAIAHAGAGANPVAAHRPAIVERNGLRFGMAAFCDHQGDFAASPGHPGIAWLDLAQEESALAAFARARAQLCDAGVDWPLLSLHWGPNMVSRPCERLRRLGRAAVDMGWKVVFGHSAHVFHGVELRAGGAIFYAAGDLVDDYAVDPALRNDHQLLFELELGPDGAIRRILLHPLHIARCRTDRADAAQAAWIAGRMDALCTEFGTALDTGSLPWTITPLV